LDLEWKVRAAGLSRPIGPFGEKKSTKKRFVQAKLGGHFSFRQAAEGAGCAENRLLLLRYASYRKGFEALLH